MRKLVIVNAQVGVSNGGITCGPAGGNYVAEAQVRDEVGKESYYVVVDVDGILEFAHIEESRFQKEIDEDYEEGEQFPEEAAFDSYDDFYEQVEDVADDEAEMLIMKYIVCLIDLDEEEAKKLIKNSVGKAVDEIYLPVCESEQNYIEDCEE